MKSLIFAAFAVISISTPAFAIDDQDSFMGTVLKYDCDEERRIETLSGTCLITLQEEGQLDAAPIGLVIHSDLYWDGGKFIAEGKRVWVDLSYTENRTEKLKSRFSPETSKVFFHDIDTSFGGYADVIKVQYRD